ncbi:MAG: 50S ribosomal protein L21 [Elusimicrobia bacterium]|nr:50S ribosomal protein L21 [Elusimicrobiota bacterium]
MPKAIISFGSYQYEVSPDGTIDVPRLKHESGEEFDHDKVLWVSVGGDAPAVIGKPYVSGAKVRFRVLEHHRGEKIRVFKKRSKKAWKKTKGFRADLTKLQVQEITAG